MNPNLTPNQQLKLLILVRNGFPKGSFMWQKRDAKVQEFIKQHQLETA